MLIKLEEIKKEKPAEVVNFLVETRQQLGRALKEKVKAYVESGHPIDDEFLKFASEEMKKLPLERYINESNQKRSSAEQPLKKTV